MSDADKLDLILDKIVGIDNRLDSIETRLDSIETRLDSVETRLDSMEKDITSVKKDVSGIKVSIENEINHNIRLIAEGHLDLSRNLHDAMKPSTTIEMLQIEVNVLKTKVRDLELKIS